MTKYRFLLGLPVVGCAQNTPISGPGPEPFGDDWPAAPIPEPGGGGGGDGDEEDDEGGSDGDGDGDDADSLSFVPEDDFASVSECDPFAQDCPDGEKCVPYASAGGEWDANKCVPVVGDHVTGEVCESTGMVEATDDCDASGVCWDFDRTLIGVCTEFCGGTPDAATCPEGTSCVISNEGSVTLCLDEDGLPLPPPPSFPGEVEDDTTCPETNDPIVMYLSNDDSNSQASPILARRRIQEGLVIQPDDVRIHEFLNYYDLSYDNAIDQIEVGLQMRPLVADATSEFRLLLYAQAGPLDAARPPMNLVLSLDTSGSMGGEPMHLVKASMTALAHSLQTGDRVSLVSWNSTPTVMLSGWSVSGPGDPVLLDHIESLSVAGDTDLYAGLVTAYELAKAHYSPGGINRVILMSDGGANAGQTSVPLIANEADEADNEYIYLMGVGVGSAAEYQDGLMDDVTDAGKGAYLFIDSEAEAERMFGERFGSLTSVAARDVRMELTMPWYFGVKAFHGEGISGDPQAVESQHLAADDAMSFHSFIAACDPTMIDPSDPIKAKVEYLDPQTAEPKSAELSMKISDLLGDDASELRKADVVVAYAKALIVIGDRWIHGEPLEAITIAGNMTHWLEQAAVTLDDPEVAEMADLMEQYGNSLIDMM